MSAEYLAHLELQAAYYRVPEHCREGLIAYLGERRATGGFLMAVLANDLAGAWARADDDNRAHLGDYVAFLTNVASAQAWGSRAKVEAWLSDPGPAPECWP
jgi:hypothetical protein